jgi:histidyl-tRNA synthetase
LEIQGFDEAKQDRIIHSLDKGDFKAVETEVTDPVFLALLGVKGGPDCVKQAMESLDDALLKEMLNGLTATLDLLGASEIPFIVDFSMARGLDYYTGIVFDIRVEGLGSQNQVCGGGRYDNLVGLFGGPPTAAVGFAFGLDRLIESMQEQGVKLPGLRIDVCVIPVSDDVRQRAFAIAAKLRRKLSGRIVHFDLSGRKLNRALQHANDLGASFSVIVGASELAEGSVILKNMGTQTQQKVAIGSLPDIIV